MKTSDVLREALELLGPNGENWHQGSASNDYGTKWCAMGAVWQVESLGEGCTDFLDTAAVTLGLDPQTSGEFPLRPAARFNDDPLTSFEDVRLMFKHAIADAEANE